MPRGCVIAAVVHSPRLLARPKPALMLGRQMSGAIVLVTTFHLPTLNDRTS